VAVIASQVPEFLGIAGGAPPPAEFLEKIPWLIAHLPRVNPATLAIAAASVLFIHFWPRTGHHRHVPGSIIALVAATALVTALAVYDSLRVVTDRSAFRPDAIPRALPPFPWPAIPLERLRDLIAPATTIAILCATESLLSAVVADGLINDRHDANTELIAQGV